MEKRTKMFKFAAYGVIIVMSAFVSSSGIGHLASDVSSLDAKISFAPPSGTDTAR